MNWLDEMGSYYQKQPAKFVTTRKPPETWHFQEGDEVYYVGPVLWMQRLKGEVLAGQPFVTVMWYEGDVYSHFGSYHPSDICPSNPIEHNYGPLQTEVLA